MPVRTLRPAAACAAALACFSAPAFADDEAIIVTARATPDIENAKSSSASVEAAAIARTINAVNVEDTVKYLPSLIVRKRHIGDTQAPIATRTSGLGASARSLIYADGALLSALIGNNNTSASPRWATISTEEIARIDVLYGPFSAAYPGNSIGAVVNITTRLPDRLEASVNGAVNIQSFDQYGTHRTLPTAQAGASIGDRFGPLALFAAIDHVTSNSQPLGYATALQPAGNSNAGQPVTGAVPGHNRTGQPIRILGATGQEHQRQDRLRFKAALDLADNIRLTYSAALFANDTDARPTTYLRSAAGMPVYAGAMNIEGRSYTIPASTFASGLYETRQRHWSHTLSLAGASPEFEWRVIGTVFDYAHDVQRVAGTALPGAFQGGAGTVTRLDGTGWRTFDAKALWQAGAGHRLGFGAHGDWFTLNSNRYRTADWIGGPPGTLDLRAHGKSRTTALWAQDEWTLTDTLTFTAGGRYEWWRAYDGENFSLAPALAIKQPRRSADHFSPKASIAWTPVAAWTARLSFGQAWRFPTLGELYQIVTTPVPAVPDPNLRPERDRSEELAIEHRNGRGTLRLSLFNEAVKDALISQSGPLPGVTPTQIGNFVQNVPRTRARGVELAAEQRDLLPRLDLSGSVTYADAKTRANPVFPASIGKQLPSVPRWKATMVGTWRPAENLSLTAAMRYASRSYGALDNSDIVGNTYQGFYKYLVVDLRAQLKVDEHLTLGLGVDNIGRDRYFLFHPFPQRAVQFDARWKL